jgi:PAS domain S-box-containing protein
MLVLVAAICATGLLLYRQYEVETREDAQDLVTAVARQKAQTLEIWLNGRASAASAMRTAAPFLELVEQLVARLDAKALPRIRQILDTERRGFQSTLLVDVQGAPLTSVGPLDLISAELRDRVRTAAATGTAQMHFLHRDEDLPGKPIFLDYLVPLAAPGSAGEPIAVLVLRHDPERFFFPLIQTWPGSSASAETLLVRADGDRVQFLNSLRHKADAAFRLTRPRTEQTLPAAQAVFGLPRLDKNLDHRGIEVVYDHQPIHGTGWHLVAKIDAAEILHSVRDAGVAAFAVTLGLILAVGGSAIVYWRQQLRLFAANRHAVDLQHEALSKHLDLMSRHANDAIFLYDESGAIVEANERAVERYGYPRDELIGMSARQLRAPNAAPQGRAGATQANETGSHIYETQHRRKDGSEFPVEASLRVVDLDGKRLTQGIIRDITARKQADARITRLLSLKDALSRVNHAIVHAESEQPLYDEICTVLVERAGFDYAGIGIAEPESGEMRWVASAGAGGATLAQARRTVRADQPEGRGLTGTAIRERRHVISQDFLADPSTAPWHEIGRTIGIGSAATFPIMRGDAAIGVINVYSRTRQAFDDEVVALLDEAAQDVSFALGNLVREAESKRAAEKIRDSELRFRQTFELAASGIAHIALDGQFLRVNRKLCEMLGYQEEELIRYAVKDVSHPDDRNVTDVQRARLRSQEINSASFEKRYLRKDGSVIWVSLTVALARNAAGEPDYEIGVFEDITERKAQQEKIERLSRVYAVLSGINAAIVRIGERDELFRETCRIAVEQGGFGIAQMLLVNEDAYEVWPGPRAGMDALPVVRASFRPGAETISKQGTTIRAIRERKPVFTNDITAEPPVGALRAEALRRGYGSVISLPLMVRDRIVAVLLLNAKEKNFFDDQELRLLGELAGDVSFALEGLERERARRKAKARANELLSIVNRSPAVFIKWNASDERPVEVVSDNIAEFGYAPDDFISGGLKFTDIVHSEDRARFIEERKRAEREGQSVVVREYRVLTRDGQIRWVEDRTWIQRDTAGRITHYQGLIQDITTRKQNEAELRAAEEQFRGLVEQSISGIWIIQDGRIVYANPRIAEIFGYASPAEMVGRDVLERIAEKDRALVTENIRRRIAGEVKSVAYTITGLRKDGALVEIGGQGTVASYRGRPAIIGVLQDITERKLAEEATARHLAEMQQAMMATVHVASTMGELRDPYTSGHERRVGELSAAIGAELGLSDHQVEGLRVAGYLHDSGKIMVPSEILSKPGKISPIEFALIKEHAQQGYEILKGVNFPWPVALVALQHHERLDGTGYPKGLQGEEIVLEARILAIADTVEAMGSHRPYRPGLGIEKALAEIEQHRGTRYDPQAADACLRLFREKGYQLPA